MVDLYPWSMVSQLLGLGVLALGTVLVILGGMRWTRRGRPGPGRLIATGSLVVALLTVLGPWLRGVVDAEVTWLVLHRWTFLPRLRLPWSLGWGVALALVGVGQGLIGVAVLVARGPEEQA